MSRPHPSRTGAWASTALAVARRPDLWRAAAAQGRRLVPPRWWARRPYLPLPDRRWMRFRLETQYGDATHPPVADDVVTWLAWTASQPRKPRDGARRQH